MLSESQKVWIRIRTNIMLVLICIQTICKGYQQTTKIPTSKEKIMKACHFQVPFKPVQTL